MANAASTAEMLSKTRVFGALGDECCEAIAKEMRDTSFSSGQMVFTRGDEGRDCYLVLSGRIRLSVLTAEGRELSFAHAETGALFGEIAMIDGGPRTADATAVNKVTAATLSRAAFERLIAQHPPISEAMLQFMCQRIREADQQLEAIALCPIEVRLARFFLANARARDEDADSGEVSVPFTMSQSELALLIGASRPKVNTALSMLETNGALKRGKDTIVCSIDALEDIADMI